VRAARDLLLCFFAIALAVALIPLARAQISADEQRKRELFLRARESINPQPASTPAAAPVRPKPRPRPTAPPEEEREEPAPARSKEEPAAPRAKEEPDPTPRPKVTPRPTPQPEEKSEEQLPPPQEEQKNIPPPVVEKTPLPTPSSAPPPISEPVPAAPITIEKSGLEEDQGLEPAPQTERRGFFGLGGARYRYLTRSVRSGIDRAPVKRSRWRYIVVHNSGTRQGNARIFNNYHLNVRHMKNGMAYHFVIGNGSSSGDGEIEIGSRWMKQINGGHVASDYLNNISIGICLVGDFNRDKPTEAQLAALDELLRYLRGRVGKVKGHLSVVKAHREINPKPTDCPGDRFPYHWLHRRFDD
jgi:hypothetical protein